MPTALSTTVFAVAIISVLLLLVLLLAEKNQKKSLRILGIQWLQAMRMMLMHLQKHRGLSSAYLAGSMDSKKQLDAVRDQISADIDNITNLGEWIHDNQDWQGVTRHWAKLSMAGVNMSADQSFNQHCRLIASVLVLLEEIAQHHQLENNSRYSDLKFIWHELLNIAELIGQSRAIGMQVLGLNNRNSSLVQHKAQIKQGLEELEKLVDLPACKRKFSTREIAELSGFIEFVRVHLVQNIGPISANEYFNKASATIEIVYQRFDEEMQKLHRLVSR